MAQSSIGNHSPSGGNGANSIPRVWERYSRKHSMIHRPLAVYFVYGTLTTKGIMLTTEQLDKFKDEGFLIIREAIPDSLRKELKWAIDFLHEGDGGKYSEKKRWDARNCLLKDSSFLKVMRDQNFLSIPVQILGWNIKVLTSHIVKMDAHAESDEMPILFHQDGGSLPFELLEPLPPLFIKIGFCVSGVSSQNGGQLRVVPGSHRLVGLPIMKTETEPYAAITLDVRPGDITLLDWRCWHAVSPNKSKIVRRNFYLGFGFRWLMPMDSETTEVGTKIDDPITAQLLGKKVTNLGNYLPTLDDVPLRSILKDLEVDGPSIAFGC